MEALSSRLASDAARLGLLGRLAMRRPVAFRWATGAGGDVRRLRLEESWRPVAVAGGEDVKNVLTFEVYVLGPNIYCCESHTESHIETI